jgi:hypothetical protein
MKMTTWQSLHQHFSASKIHLDHPDHRFRIFIKFMGEDRIFRVEESLHPEKRAIEASPGQWSAEGVH